MHCDVTARDSQCFGTAKTDLPVTSCATAFTTNTRPVSLSLFSSSDLVFPFAMGGGYVHAWTLWSLRSTRKTVYFTQLFADGTDVSNMTAWLKVLEHRQRPSVQDCPLCKFTMRHCSTSKFSCVLLKSQLLAARLKLSSLLRLKIADWQAMQAFAHNSSVA